MKLLTVVGTRPQFLKLAPLSKTLAKHNINLVVVHTGQHYDPNMSDAFFDDLGLPSPDIYLDVKSGSHAEQTGKLMIAFEKLCEQDRPDMVLVVGDVNATVACSLRRNYATQVPHFP